MPAESRFEGWRGTLLVAASYVYFLIFAQFGFLRRLDEQHLSGAWLKPVMAAMATAGILASLVTAGALFRSNPRRRLQWAWFGCGLAALLSAFSVDAVSFLIAAALVGGSLGLLTVTLVTHLRLWTGGDPIFKVALGTGCAYLICNYPPLFMAGGRAIALVAAACSLVGLVAASRTLAVSQTGQVASARGRAPFALVLMWFTALVWFDSAAFFIIQNSPALKSGTWEGARHLWLIGGLHFAAAIAGAFLLRTRGIAAALSAAFSCLAAACLFLDASHPIAAAVLYPIGVSIYSVALVVYPSLLTGTLPEAARSWRAGLLYAIAGWIGSAMGIGMAQHLHALPATFIASAAALFVVPLVGFRREVVAVAGVLATAFIVWRLLPAGSSASGDGAIAEGRQVYISEGCISCHSQYVRPNSQDVEMWGPAQDLETVRRQKPPLIGNRRQGPDLSEVASRRSALWLRIHLIDPRAVSYRSVMPSYAYLFSDSRGDVLVKYLASLRSPGSARDREDQARIWTPKPDAGERAKHLDGRRLFEEHCATCHQPGGRVRSEWGSRFKRLPPNLFSGRLPFRERNDLARIVKFGLPGTNMPGHEYLPDDEIQAIAGFVAGVRAGTPPPRR